MNFRSMKKYFSGSLLALAIVALFTTTATNFKGDHGKYFEISKNIEIFTNLYRELNTYYVDELDPSKLMRTGIDAMLESLDPYTNYISESDIEGYRFITEGKYTGIGAQFSLISSYPTITEVYENTPSQKAGLKAGDVIEAIDGRSAANKSAEDVNDIMKGYPGTSVELTIKRPGDKKTQKITLTREEVSVQNVPYSGMISDEVGYVVLTTFTREAGRNIANAFKKLKTDNPNMKGIVLDLRGNGGGLLTEAVNLCNVFIPKGELVVSTKGKIKDWDRSFKTLNAPVDTDIPLVVLIDKGSASASEIVSGTIQDLDRGVLVGQRSYGKGLVQNMHDVGYNSKVKITTSKYYIPSGRCIQSVEYKKGEPVDIADEKREAFKTRSGRKVLDGGGVKPDVFIDPDDNSNILTTLKEKHLIFDYATEFAMKNKTIAAVEDFRFSDWKGFIQFLDNKQFDYDTETEKLLDQLKERADEDGYLVASDLTSLEAKIITEKKNDLNKYKDVINDLIEKEIVSRYYFQDGKIKIGLRNDLEIKEAIDLIKDPARYDRILSGKGS